MVLSLVPLLDMFSAMDSAAEDKFVYAPRLAYQRYPCCKRRRINYGMAPSFSGPLVDFLALVDDSTPSVRTRKVPAAKKEDCAFRTDFDVSGFDPKDVKVRVDSEARTVTVEASRVTPGSERRTRQVVSLPKGCDAARLRAAVVPKQGGGDLLRIEEDRKAIEHDKPEVQKQIEANVEAAGDIAKGEKEEVASSEAAAAVEEKEAASVEVEDVGGDDKMDAPAHEDAAAEMPVEIVGLSHVEKGDTNKDKVDDDKEEEEEEPFTALLDVHGFPYESLVLEVKTGDVLRLSGKVEEVDLENGATYKREFSRELAVRPVGKYDLEDGLSWRMEEDGKLRVEVRAKKATTAAEKEKEDEAGSVPIEVRLA